MNSFIGRTILKPILDKIEIIKNEDDLARKVAKNYNKVKTVVQNPKSGLNIWREWKETNDHFNLPHIGVEILAVSKMMMNEVVYLGEDLGFPTYTTDTDSTHINYSSWETICEKFQKDNKFKKDLPLDGPDMLQFHADFEVKKDGKAIKAGAGETIILGKKVYCDILVDAEKFDYNNPVEDQMIDIHYRMKGITSDCIIVEALRRFGHRYSDLPFKKKWQLSVRDLYLWLFNEDDFYTDKRGFLTDEHGEYLTDDNGELKHFQEHTGINFNLLDIGESHEKFKPEFSNCFNIKQKKKFNRRVSFAKRVVVE